MPARLSLAFVLTAFSLLADAGSARAANVPKISYPAACAPVSQADFDRAHTLFLSGKQFLDEANYDKAVSYFLDSYSVNCNLHEILVSIATVLERKGDRAEAIRALREFLSRAPSSPDADKIERRIRNLEEQVAPSPPTSEGVSPPAKTEATKAPEQAAPAAEVAMHDEHPTEHRSHVGPWVLVAGGGAVLAAGVALYAVEASASQSLQHNSCPSGVCQSSTNQQQGNRDDSMAYAGLGIAAGGLAIAASGLIWLAVSPAHDAPHPPRMSLAPILLPTMKGATASFTF